jgi:plastocyanin
MLVAAVLGAPLLTGGAISAMQTDPAGINIDNFSFAPGALVIAKGTRVTWTNRDDIPHTVTDAAGQRAFKSSPLDTGDAFSYTFSNAGTYHYFCSLHPKMEGTVVVQ